ncbi:MAG: DUF4845 domain-containing protein [Candidatus Accumulibacter sp.]|nr:DUF4845 domain-containing protein [Accumulibacter sp.]
MHRQRGVALSGLLFWGVIIAVVAMLGIKVAPAVIDYYTILKNVKAVAASSSGRTVPEIRNAYSKYSEVDHTKTLEPSDLDISKDGNEIVIAFSYEKRIHLFANVSLLIEFQGSSSGRS